MTYLKPKCFWSTQLNVANMMDEVRNNGLLILVSRKLMENEMGNKHVINKRNIFCFSLNGKITQSRTFQNT